MAGGRGYDDGERQRGARGGVEGNVFFLIQLAFLSAVSM
jgi:hypothetical protein